MQTLDPLELTFTQSIVGPPMSVSLGLRSPAADYSKSGLEIGMVGTGVRLSRDWMDWWLLRTQDDWLTAPRRRRPTRVRRWLERYALVLGTCAAFVLAEHGFWLLRN